jgi:hypothetical protein
MFAIIDTVYVPDSINPEILIPNVFIYKLKTDINSIVFREKWTIHPKKGLVKEIIAFCPVATIYADNGRYFGSNKLFWIK